MLRALCIQGAFPAQRLCYIRLLVGSQTERGAAEHGSPHRGLGCFGRGGIHSGCLQPVTGGMPAPSEGGFGCAAPLPAALGHCLQSLSSKVVVPCLSPPATPAGSLEALLPWAMGARSCAVASPGGHRGPRETPWAGSRCWTRVQLPRGAAFPCWARRRGWQGLSNGCRSGARAAPAVYCCRGSACGLFFPTPNPCNCLGLGCRIISAACFPFPRSSAPLPPAC